MQGEATAARRGGRVREWLARYGPAEVAALLGALTAAAAGYRLGGPVVAAVAGSVGEAAAFYAVIVVRDVRQARAPGQGARSVPRIVADVLLEFGPAELLDTLAVRPVAMYIGPLLLGSLAAGIVAGKLAADVVFYALAIIGYELRKHLATRRRPVAHPSILAAGPPAVGVAAVPGARDMPVGIEAVIGALPRPLGVAAAIHGREPLSRLTTMLGGTPRSMPLAPAAVSPARAAAVPAPARAAAPVAVRAAAPVSPARARAAAPVSPAGRALDVDRPDDPLAPEALDRLTHRTPYLLLDLDRVERAYLGLLDRLGVDAIHYAVKCNPDPRVLATLDRLGCRFQVASQAELVALVGLGVAPAEVLCSNPVKPVDHIRRAYRSGCWRFAADSVTELDKLALHAPGSAVYVRLRMPGAGRLGVDPATAADLLRTAAHRGLRPYGVTFHVGSQATDPGVWGAAIAQAGTLMAELDRVGLRLEMLDLGGGFPARYEDGDPDLGGHGAAIRAAVARLPYRPRLVAEPGRALVAEAGVLVGTVVGTAVRDGRIWVHLDVGAFNGVMEALATGAARAFPVSDSRRGQPLACHLAGPTCDSRDTLRLDVPLSAGLTVGDRVYLGTAGAYTTAHMSSFNGFDLPHTWCVSSRLDGRAVPAAR